MQKLTLLSIVLLLPLLLFSFIREGSGLTSEEEEIIILIQTATSPEDHRKIADYFDRQAKMDEEKARFYASMADSYANRDKPLLGLAKNYSGQSKKYKEMAQGYKNLAAEHRKMADQEMQKNY
ncbi:MAG: hypothetical protein ACREOW_05020 [Thermodesulfobacteriota bacterium]